MECIAQYLDDLEDLFFAAALVTERLRRLAGRMIRICLFAAVLASGVFLALREPPLALALATLMTVTLLYRAAVHQPPRLPAST